MQKKVPGCYIMPSALSPLSKFNGQSNSFVESWQYIKIPDPNQNEIEIYQCSNSPIFSLKLAPNIVSISILTLYCKILAVTRDNVLFSYTM